MRNFDSPDHGSNLQRIKHIFNIRSDFKRDTVIWQTDWAWQQGSTSGTNSCP